MADEKQRIAEQTERAEHFIGLARESFDVLIRHGYGDRAAADLEPDEVYPQDQYILAMFDWMETVEKRLQVLLEGV
jgi:hypothetical protein